MWMMNHLKVEHRGNSSFYDDFQLSLAHQAFEESRIDRSFNKSERTSRTEEVNAYSVNLDFIKNTGERNLFFYGLEYVQNDVLSRGTSEDIAQGIFSGAPSRYPDATWRSLAAYVNNEFRWSQQWTLQAGLRYNRFSLDADFRDNQEYFPLPFEEASLANNALTGSLGAVFRPGGKWVIRVNAGTAFRAPNVDDVGKIFDSEPGAVVVPNADLEAEQAYNLDLGVATTIGRRVNLDITAYYTSLQNALVRRNFTLNGQDSILYDGTLSRVQAMQNAAKANVYGLQFGLNIDLPRGFAFRSNVNIQRGEEELDDGSVSPSRHAAPFFGVSRLTYEAGPLRLQAYVQFQGERSFENLSVDERGKDEIYAKDNQGRNYAPAWYTLNVKAQYQVSESFSLSGGLENMTDQRYRPYSSGLSGPGRHFILAANVDF
jgi:hemoglobin/transferrin/lactoferrin receptor protein